MDREDIGLFIMKGLLWIVVFVITTFVIHSCVNDYHRFEAEQLLPQFTVVCIIGDKKEVFTNLANRDFIIDKQC